MDKHNLQEKSRDTLVNTRRIIFIAILIILLLVMASILLLIWWPSKATWVEITNSWVSLIMVYLVLILFLFARPIYNFYNEVFDFITKPGESRDKQAKQQELFFPIPPDEFQELFTGKEREDDKEEDVLKKETLDTVLSNLENPEFVEKIKKIKSESLSWRFLFADTALTFNAKYVLFWFFKVKSAKLEDFEKLWQSKIEEEQERRIILEALQFLGFIRIEDDNLIITDLGSLYINYLKEIDKHPGEKIIN